MVALADNRGIPVALGPYVVFVITKGNDATITIGCTSLSSLMTPSEPNTLNKTTAKYHSASFAATESTSGPDFNLDRN